MEEEPVEPDAQSASGAAAAPSSTGVPHSLVSHSTIPQHDATVQRSARDRAACARLEALCRAACDGYRAAASVSADPNVTVYLSFFGQQRDAFAQEWSAFSGGSLARQAPGTRAWNRALAAAEATPTEVLSALCAAERATLESYDAWLAERPDDDLAVVAQRQRRRVEVAIHQLERLSSTNHAG
jgi:hypothetical protein